MRNKVTFVLIIFTLSLIALFSIFINILPAHAQEPCSATLSTGAYGEIEVRYSGDCASVKVYHGDTILTTLSLPSDQPAFCNGELAITATVINSPLNSPTYLRNSPQRINGVANNWLGRVYDGTQLVITGSEENGFVPFLIQNAWIDSRYVSNGLLVDSASPDNGTRFRADHSLHATVLAVLYNNTPLNLTGQSFTDSDRTWVQGSLTGWIALEYNGEKLLEFPACG